MVAIALAGLLGGLSTAISLWPQGALMTLLGAQLGGSGAGIVVAALIAVARTSPPVTARYAPELLPHDR